MKLAALAFRYLWARPLATVLNLLLLTLGLASITFVLLVSEQVQRSFQRDLAGIDLVVGAKGSPMQLILAGVFHIDVPPGNIALADVQALAARPQVAQVIPLSLGDSFRGFRIVGTTPDYLKHYGMRFAQGQGWAGSMEAVLGAEAARAAVDLLRQCAKRSGATLVVATHDARVRDALQGAQVLRLEAVAATP